MKKTLILSVIFLAISSNFAMGSENSSSAPYIRIDVGSDNLELQPITDARKNSNGSTSSDEEKSDENKQDSPPSSVDDTPVWLNTVYPQDPEKRASVATAIKNAKNKRDIIKLLEIHQEQTQMGFKDIKDKLEAGGALSTWRARAFYGMFAYSALVSIVTIYRFFAEYF